MGKSVELMLAERYADSGWAFFQEVWSTLGLTGNRRRADALAFGLHESKGFELHGHEVKTARNDILRELADPTKGEAFFQYCDRWWLVVSDKALVADIMDRVPSRWGILAPAGTVLKAIRRAPRLKPKPWPRGFVASVMRQASESSISRKQHDAIVADLRARQDEMVEAQLEMRLRIKSTEAERELAQVKRQLEVVLASVREYAAVTGIDLTEGKRVGYYGAGRHAAEVGKLATFLMEQGIDIGRLAAQLEEAAPLVRSAADAITHARDTAARRPHIPRIEITPCPVDCGNEHCNHITAKDPFCSPPGACADLGREQCDKHAPIRRG